jgi:hypothetical protein
MKKDRRSGPVFGPTITQEEKYAPFEEIKIRLLHSWPKKDQSFSLKLGSLPDYFIPCSNPDCNGGFFPWRIIEKMRLGNKESGEGTEMCRGIEESIGRKCANTFHYKISIEYK